MNRSRLAVTAAAVVAATLAGPAPAQVDLELLKKQVTEAERAFAKSMADRDLAAFSKHLSEHTIFYSHGGLRGKAAVVQAWKSFYEGPKAPFSWEPDQVDIHPDGTLGYTSGPVRNPEGKRTSRFNSVWRQEAPGVWRIIYDKGQPLTEAEKLLP